MNSPKISIIIPVYNVEIYLRECLDSCINQTLEDIEIICVDDCSTDNSYKILEEYSKKDPRIKILRQKENKKQGAARNKGLEFATGEYVWFIDSDDYIDVHACQILYDAIKEFDVDMLCFSALQFADNNKNRKFIYDANRHQGVQINKIYYPKTNWIEIQFSNLNATPWAYLTKRSVIQNFRFREGVWHEDTDFTPILLSSVDSFCYIPYTAYFYRININSTTQVPMSQKRFEDSINVLESLDKFVVENQIRGNHFLIHFIEWVVQNISNIHESNPKIIPGNFEKFLQLKKKYYLPQRSLPRHSFRRFIRKVLKRLFKNACS